MMYLLKTISIGLLAIVTGWYVTENNRFSSFSTPSSGLTGISSITAGSGLTGGTITTSGTVALDLTAANTWTTTGTTTFSNNVQMGSTTTGLFFSNSPTLNYLSLGSPTSTMSVAGITVPSILSADTNNTIAAEFQAHRHSNVAIVDPTIYFARSRGTAVAQTIVQNGDSLGTLGVVGYDGTEYKQAGRIDFFADGTASTTSMPGSFTVSTTPVNSITPSERLRITSAGLLGIGTTTPSQLVDIQGSVPMLRIRDPNFPGSGEGIKIGTVNVGGVAYSGIWLNQVTPDTNNYAFIQDTGAQTTIFNSVFNTQVLFRIGNNTKMAINTNGNIGIATSTVSITQSKLTVNGGIGTDGAPPVISACGTSPVLTVGSTDTAGVVTEGTVATGCTITFNVAKTQAPFCVVESDAGLGFSKTVSTTTLTITNIGALSSTALAYHCINNDL